MSESGTNRSDVQAEAEVTSNVPDSNQDEEEPVEDYDDILALIGEFGIFQFIVVVLMCFAAATEAGSIMYYAFAGNVPDHRCIVPACDDEFSTYDEIPSWLNYTTPWEDGEPSFCYIYNSSLTYNSSICDNESFVPPSSVAVKCQQFLYDKSLFESTIVTTFDLVCDESWKAASIESSYMVGMLFGAFIFGSLADKIGRRRSFLLISCVTALATIGGTYVPSFIYYAISRLAAGAGGAGMFTIGLIIGLEAVGPNYRTVTSFVFQASSSIGAILTGVVAYYVRDWQNLQLIISLPYAVFIFYFWLIPESARWLISKNRNEEAKVVIAKIARLNRKSMPENLGFLDQGQARERQVPKRKRSSKSESSHSLLDAMVTLDDCDLANVDGTLWDVLKSFTLMKRLLIMSYAWIVIVLCYFGLSIGSTSLSEEYFLDYWLSMIVELPSYLVGIWAVEKLGRKPTLAGSLLLGGIACISVAFVGGQEVLVTALASTGKFFVSLAFGVVYGYTIEIFPTASRGAALGICSTFSRLGSIAAPYLIVIESSLPYLIFGGTGIAAGVFAFFLPETLGKNLPQNMQEALDLDKNANRLFSCCRKTPVDNETEDQGS